MARLRAECHISTGRKSPLTAMMKKLAIVKISKNLRIIFKVADKFEGCRVTKIQKSAKTHRTTKK